MVIIYGKKKISVPDFLEDLNVAQYRYLLFLAGAMAAGVIGRDYFAVRWCSFLMGRGESDFTVLREDLKNTIMPQAQALANNYLNEADGTVAVRVTTCKNLWPAYRDHKGPADWLSGLRYGTFVECATLLSEAAKEDEEAARSIARRLYGMGENNDIPRDLAQHATILLASVLHAIQTEPVVINGQPIDFSIIFRSDGRPGYDNHTGWNGISMTIAETGIFGTLRDLDDYDFWTVLLYLYKTKFDHIHQSAKKI